MCAYAALCGTIPRQLAPPESHSLTTSLRDLSPHPNEALLQRTKGHNGLSPHPFGASLHTQRLGGSSAHKASLNHGLEVMCSSRVLLSGAPLMCCSHVLLCCSAPKASLNNGLEVSEKSEDADHQERSQSHLHLKGGQSSQSHLHLKGGQSRGRPRGQG